jgi:transposase
MHASRRIDRGIARRNVMANTAYDADHLRQAIATKGALAVIPNNPSVALKYPLDEHLPSAIPWNTASQSSSNSATRFEKTARNYRAVVTLAAITLWMR